VGSLPFAYPGGRFLRGLWQFSDELCFLSFSSVIDGSSDEHVEHSGGERQHSPSLELPSRQRLVRDLHRRTAIRQPRGCKPCPIHSEPFHYQMDLFLHALKISIGEQRFLGTKFMTKALQDSPQGLG